MGPTERALDRKTKMTWLISVDVSNVLHGVSAKNWDGSYESPLRTESKQIDNCGEMHGEDF